MPLVDDIILMVVGIILWAISGPVGADLKSPPVGVALK